MQSLVSVVIPSYNRARMVERALKSVVAQTYQNWEVLVVDDGSTDETEEIVAEFNKQNNRIRYIRLDSNRGACVARNVGIDESKGEYITFLDSDDEYLPEKIQLQVEVFQKSDLSNVGVVSCGRLDVRDGNTYLRWIPRKRGNILNNLLRRERIGGNTSFLMVKASLVKEKKIYFDPEMPAGQDWDFLVRICQHANFDFVPQSIVRINHHSGERVYTHERSLVAIEKQYLKYNTLLNRDTQIHDKFLLKMAVLNFLYGHRENALSILKNRVISPDFNSKLWLSYFKAFKTHRGLVSRVFLKSLKVVSRQ